jgi:hypothetical protein
MCFMNPVHILSVYLFNVHLYIILSLRPRLRGGLFLLGFPAKILYIFISTKMHATGPLTDVVTDWILLMETAWKEQDFCCELPFLNTIIIYWFSTPVTKCAHALCDTTVRIISF